MCAGMRYSIFHENSPLKAQDKRGFTILKSHSFERVQIDYIAQFANVYDVGYRV